MSQTDRRARILAGAILVGQLLCAVATTISDRVLANRGYSDLVEFNPAVLVLFVGVASASAVGAAVVRDQPRHPVGWLFLALSSVLIGSGACATWYDWGAVVEPGSLPVPGLAASIDNSSWIPWFVIIASVLALTPDGEWLSRRWRILGWVVIVAGSLSFALALFRVELDAPYKNADNPIALEGLRWLTVGVSYYLILMVAIGLIASGISLIVRWRRARGLERKRLYWLAFVVVPLPMFVVGAFVAAWANSDTVMVLATAGFVVLVPLAAGLSITRYHLYDVDRILARTTAYVLLTVILVVTYAGIVWLGADAAGRWQTSPEIAATVGALTVAVLAAPLRRGIQDLIDRRFNRRQYDAVRLITGEVSGAEPVRDVPELLRRALADPSLTVTYAGAEPGTWVAEGGTRSAPPADGIEVVRHGRVVALIGYDPATVEPGVVKAGSQAATVELDNARLRAELAGRLLEVESSRRRIAEAQRTERRRIERDLHDGAQQRLLALAFELQTAQVSGDPDRMRAALAEGATSAQTAVRDLRALANGLHPAALADGGLPAALDDLRGHSAVPVTLDVEVGRLAAGVEFTAWLVVAEASANAQKHANAHRLDISARQVDGYLNLAVTDDGRGGADLAGLGLRGLRDRVEAAGGSLVVSSGSGGTTVEAVIPCGS